MISMGSGTISVSNRVGKELLRVAARLQARQERRLTGINRFQHIRAPCSASDFSDRLLVRWWTGRTLNYRFRSAAQTRSWLNQVSVRNVMKEHARLLLEQEGAVFLELAG
jgi:hypothetical protein